MSKPFCYSWTCYDDTKIFPTTDKLVEFLKDRNPCEAAFYAHYEDGSEEYYANIQCGGKRAIDYLNNYIIVNDVDVEKVTKLCEERQRVSKEAKQKFISSLTSPVTGCFHYECDYSLEALVEHEIKYSKYSWK